jgi:hypothetical protein
MKKAVLTLVMMCFCMSIGLYAADIFVWGGNTINGAGTSTNPFKYISSAITLAQSLQQDNTIHIRGMGSIPYTQNLTISGFQYAITLKRWSNYTAEVLIKGTGTDYSTILIGDATMVKLQDLTISRTSQPTVTVDPLRGGGVAVYNNNPNNLTIIERCIIRDSRAYLGGGLYAENSNVQILDSKLYNNTGIYCIGTLVLGSYGGAIYGFNSNITISRTLFYNNSGGNLGNGSCYETIYMCGGTLACESTTLTQDNIYYSVEGQYYTHTYKNSIISKPNINNNPFYLFCLGYNTDLTSLPGVGNIIADPKFTNPSVRDYSLKWDSEGPSQCIGTGYNIAYDDNPNDQNYNQNLRTVLDETQDIGSVNYAWDRFATYSFTNDPQSNWMCFPVIDDKTNRTVGGITYLADVMLAYFRQYETSPNSPMTSVSFRWYGPNGYDTYTHFPLTPITWHNMLGFLGYKALFNQNSIMNTLHGCHRPYNSPVEVPEPNEENWIGYFVPETQTPQFAFGSFLDELYSIKTKNWSMDRVKPKRGSPWIITPNMTLSYGDLVIVKKFGEEPGYSEIENFVWQRLASQQQYLREEPTFFSFAKEPDYTPIYVQVDSLSIAKEIAILVDGECYGAAVIDNNLVMIQAFISSVPDGSDIQLVTWVGAKSQASPINFNLYDSVTDQFVPCSRLIKENTDFYYVKLGNNEQNGITSEIVGLRISNYPNPFNPSTTINYNIPKDGDVKLNIYNLKGQLVKTLVSESKKSGSYKITWNGDDQAGNRVSSGLYFTRIESNGKTLTNKMLMLK